jgi:hypothetical protein
LRQSASRWRRGSKLARISKHRKLPIGTVFSFRLSGQAVVTFRFTQKQNGRRVGRKCLAQTNKNRHRGACKRTVTAGSLTFPGHSATNTVVFQGRLSRSKKLKPGQYTLIVVAANSAGVSTPQSLSFTIVS